MDLEDLLERYEVFGDEGVYAEALRRYEDALAAEPADARLLTGYGYLQECHGRRAVRAAADGYERAIAADPHDDKTAVHVSNILAKLGARTRLKAAVIAHRLGLD